MSKSRFALEFLKTAHIELTDRCNAACPLCVRNINGGPDNPYLPNKEISFDNFKKVFTPEILGKMNKVYFCGNYGDPALSNHIVEIAKYIRETAPKVHIGMNTNGGVGSPKKWSELGKILNQPNDYCYFSIDGLQDTNHLYRRNVRWEHIMQSAKAFIDAGGTAKWDFIVFKHNEHQVEEARALANEMGFTEFCVKRSGRFFYIKDDVRLEAIPVYSKSLEYEYCIEPPTQAEFTNNIVKEYQQKNIQQYDKKFDKRLRLRVVKNEYRPLELLPSFFKEDNAENEHTTRAKISCRVLKDQSIFISSEGLVFPCCWTAYPINSFWDNNDGIQLNELIRNTGGKEALSIHHHSLEEILNGEFFHRVGSSWDKPCAKEGKLISCSFQCGEHLEKLSEENVKI